MRATVLLFALARDRAGESSLTVELPPSPTVGDLKAALVRACPILEPLLPSSRIAIDSEYAHSDDQLIPQTAELAVIPPVSGGSVLEFPANP